MPKIVRFLQTKAAEVLKLEDVPLSEPGKGEVHLKVEAIGLNRAEVIFRQGQYLEAPLFTSGIGYEVAGIVGTVGPGDGDIQIGDRVSTIPSFSVGKYGVYGESAIVPAYAVAGFPDNLTSDPEMMARGKKFTYDGLSSGALKPITARTFALEEIVEAHCFMESNHQMGEIVVTV